LPEKGECYQQRAERSLFEFRVIGAMIKENKVSLLKFYPVFLGKLRFSSRKRNINH